MDLGMIGLGRMGGNMARRLIRARHRVVGYAPRPESVRAVVADGAVGADSLAALAAQLLPPRHVWMMIPAGEAVDEALAGLRPHLSPGDLLVDGGNSNYRDSQRRGTELARAGVELVDAGVSGGIWGLENGYGLMVGGTTEAVERLRPVLEALAPAPDRGWGHLGPLGAGHFAKMVHNGIEYGMMQALGEGFALMAAKEEFGYDLAHVAEAWRHGTVIRSWLIDLAAAALADDPSLEGLAAWVEDSGEGRWTAHEAIDLGVPAPIITQALFARFRSRLPRNFADRLIASLRAQFGGHPVQREPRREA